MINDFVSIKGKINKLRVFGGIVIDKGLKLGIEELNKGRKEFIFQVFILIDGENEYGDNDFCFKLVKLVIDYNIILNFLGFGDDWN